MANGIYWREKRQVEMWTAPNDCIGQPQIWDLLGHHGRGLSSAVWFPLHSKGCEADYVCTPAPIHNPDGSESLWCYTRPAELYGTLRDTLGHFPLDELLGTDGRHPIEPRGSPTRPCWPPGSGSPISSTSICRRSTTPPSGPGPESAAADQAVADLDEVIGRLAAGMAEAYDDELLWLVAGEYAITPVDHVSYPNRVLREAGLLAVREEPDGEHLDLERSQAFAMVDHQFSHVFVADGDQQLAARVAEVFRGQPGIAEVLVGTAARPLQPGTSPQRRGDPDFHAAKLAGVLLVAVRRPGAAVRPHGRYPPQAGLRPGGVVLRSGHQEHPARRRSHQRLARRAGRRPLAAERTVEFRAGPVPRPVGRGHRRVRRRAEAFWLAVVRPYWGTISPALWASAAHPTAGVPATAFQRGVRLLLSLGRQWHKLGRNYSLPPRGQRASRGGRAYAWRGMP